MNYRLLTAAALGMRDAATCGTWRADEFGILTIAGMDHAGADLLSRAALLRKKADEVTFVAEQLQEAARERLNTARLNALASAVAGGGAA